MENSRNTHFIGFKSLAILNKVIDSPTILEHPMWTMNHPSVQCMSAHTVEATHPLALNRPILGYQTYCHSGCIQITLTLVSDVTKHKNGHAGYSHMPQRSHSILFLREECKYSTQKGIPSNSYAEIAKVLP